MNCNSKPRCQSLDAQDLYEGHIGGLDTLARAFLAAAAQLEPGELERALAERYNGWNGALGQARAAGKRRQPLRLRRLEHRLRIVDSRSGRDSEDARKQASALP